MVEKGEAGDKTLVERLREAPQKITSFLSDTSKQYLAHALRLVKSFWHAANLALIGDGLAEGCSDDKFAEYVEEVNPSLIRLSVHWSSPPMERCKQLCCNIPFVIMNMFVLHRILEKICKKHVMCNVNVRSTRLICVVYSLTGRGHK